MANTSGDTGAPEGSPVSREVIDTVVDRDAVVEGVTVSEQPRALRPVAGGRHEARERAVHLLYESEMKGLPIDEVLGAQVLAADPFTDEVARGVAENRSTLDTMISERLRGWTMERMPHLDLMILRVACYELLHRPDIPTGAILSEAVDLASHYGTDESARFVNGLLSNVAREVRPD